jgi:hypothetical protein
MYLLQDDIVKFVCELASPPRLVNIPEEEKGKAKERREVGEGDDTVTRGHIRRGRRGDASGAVPVAVEVQPPWTAQCTPCPRSSD